MEHLSMDYFWNDSNKDLNNDFENLSTPPDNILMGHNMNTSLEEFLSTENRKAYNPTLSSYAADMSSYAADSFDLNDDLFSYDLPTPSPLYDFNDTPMQDSKLNVSSVRKPKTKKRSKGNLQHNLTSDRSWYDGASSNEAIGWSGPSFAQLTSPSDLCPDMESLDLTKQEVDCSGDNLHENYLYGRNTYSVDSQDMSSNSLSSNTTFRNCLSPQVEEQSDDDYVKKKKRMNLAKFTLEEKYERTKNLNNEASRKYRKNKVTRNKCAEERFNDLKTENASLRTKLEISQAFRDECQTLNERIETYAKSINVSLR